MVWSSWRVSMRYGGRGVVLSAITTASLGEWPCAQAMRYASTVVSSQRLAIERLGSCTRRQKTSPSTPSLGKKSQETRTKCARNARQSENSARVFSGRGALSQKSQESQKTPDAARKLSYLVG